MTIWNGSISLFTLNSRHLKHSSSLPKSANISVRSPIKWATIETEFLALPVYRWRSRLSRSNLVAVAVATLHLAKLLFWASSASSILARKRRRQFSMHAERHFLGSSGHQHVKRVLAFRSRVSRATLSGATFYGFRAAFQASQERRHFQSAISSRAHASISSRSGVQAFRDRRQAVQECWHFTNAGILRRRHFHVICHVSLSCVRCYVSCLMPHVSCVICRMLCVMCQVCIMWHMSWDMCHVMCRVPYVMSLCRVPYVMVL
jgi:hypothetical protein